ncbi:MAG: hypothetical protein VX938_10245, partial [Myxococcota bacterium]|nr:hypothetical protein [Myxococcota bacterium]
MLLSYGGIPGRFPLDGGGLVPAVTELFADLNWWSVGVAFAVGVVVIFIHDVVQRKHAILRNFPVIGHFRYLLELIGPELRQYWV